MHKLSFAVAILAACVGGASAQETRTLTSLRAVHSLTNDEAARHLPAEFEGTVTYIRSYESTLFVQDEGMAIYVQLPAGVTVAAGDRISIKGVTEPSFRPFVRGDIITLVSHGALPKPVPATYDEMIRAERDCMLVKVRGVVRAADLVLSSQRHSTKLQMLAEGGPIDVVIDSDDASALRDLLDAEVEVTAVASGRFDGKMQQTGVVLHATSLADVNVLRRASVSPWTLPVKPMDEVLTTYHAMDSSARVHVRGTITYYSPGTTVVLQDGYKSLWINTNTVMPLRIGTVVDATGFPDAHDGFLTLSAGEIAESPEQAPIHPAAYDWKQLSSSKHVFDLVSIEATVVTEFSGASQDEYALVADGYMFSAVYRHPEVYGVLPLPPMKQLAVGSRVRVTGICVLDSANPFDRNVPFNILLRTSDDVTVLAQPSWLTIGHLLSVAGLLLLAVIAVAGWGATLRAKVRRQTAALSARVEREAAQERESTEHERRRSRILEGINGTEPLADILEQIAALISLRLGSVPCWCEVTDGALLGQRPPAAERARVVQVEIPARSGEPLGSLFAAFDAASQANDSEIQELSAGARLATLAIETRRLYADLLHRSEFDLLTDILNRFALDKQLGLRIDEARKEARIFGLIYIDLDNFKKVNDEYGHHVGDLYLREVSLRMKRQLRTQDALARLGGDEFAALVPVVRNRAEVEEIALRLEKCFEEPMVLEGSVLTGSASVGIAIYPEDGTTGDTLLNAADRAMYAEKNSKSHAVVGLRERDLRR